MQRLFFVRHGKTELNLGNYVQGGGIDSPLLEESLRDAEKTGKYLNTEHIEHVIVSPQQRAVQTAELITNKFTSSYTVDFVEGFKEMMYGTWEGLRISDVEKNYPTLFHHLRNQPELYDPKDIKGETYEQLTTRGRQTILDAVSEYPGEDILFVGHSILIMCTVLSLLGKGVEDYRSFTPLDNTSITLLHYEDQHFTLEKWNSTEHL
ncbi:probable phosphoglycerate mutase [Alkalibacterium subtropicum]|uniref:Probable phosphoglycerate mutase n=1 Tax=Alkalibacterium subtropicum TaxID=753702 RepID=A0A1I1HYS2_9LACT|nr:histidine phosphatase family protein [Alkalibacterium subtropicum]SFC28981.1 probable phosphoglycerate mutase [Alkalibacterium subtropicum]